MSVVALLYCLASARLGGLVGAGLEPSSGITPSVSYAGAHLRSSLFAFHLKLPASTRAIEQPMAAKPRTLFIVGPGEKTEMRKQGRRPESRHGDSGIQQFAQERDSPAQTRATGTRAINRLLVCGPASPFRHRPSIRAHEALCQSLLHT